MSSGHAHQRGISLFVVMIMVLLTTLLVMWASRTAFFNELVTSNDADYQRALEAAQALMRDAELDVKGQKPDGSACSATYGGSCREAVLDLVATPPKAFFPKDSVDFENLQMILTNISTETTASCAAGICIAHAGWEKFWTDQNKLHAMENAGAHYGQFTGTSALTTGNPSLATGKSWYWVEILPFNTSMETASGRSVLVPDGNTPFIYRITAIATGKKDGTLAVVQNLFVWKKTDS